MGNVVPFKQKGNEPHKPTRCSKEFVQRSASIGCTQVVIYNSLNITRNTLVKYYSKQLSRGISNYHQQLDAMWLQAALAGDSRLLAQHKARMYLLSDRCGELEVDVDAVTEIKITHVGPNE